MTSFARLHEDSNKAGVEFLMAELDTAMTFLDVAETTSSEENRSRNCGNARIAYETVMRMRERVLLDGGQSQALDQKLADVRKRLAISE